MQRFRLHAGQHGKTSSTKESFYRKLMCTRVLIRFVTLSGLAANIDCVTGHVNNVVYNRYAESARVNWGLNFATMDPAHTAEWTQLMTPTGIGLILRSIRTDYKFVRPIICRMLKLFIDSGANIDHGLLYLPDGAPLEVYS